MRVAANVFGGLNQTEIETIHRNMLRILAEVGMLVESDDLLEALAAVGGQVTRASQTVRFRVERDRLLALCPLVFAAAEQGDAAAANIPVRCGRALAEYAIALARRFAMLDLKFDVVLAGSLFKGRGPLLIDTVTQAIHVVVPRAHIVRAPFEPAVGSVLLAYDALGLSPSDEVYANLARTIPIPPFFDTAEGDGRRPAVPS